MPGKPSQPGVETPLAARRDVQAETPASLGRLGHYELLQEIARGGMGIVYRARDLTLNRVVALKLMLSGQFAGEREVRRFRAEAEAAARLQHPNIVPIFEFGELEGRSFLSMGLVDGANLATQLHGIPMDATPAARLISTLARAIHYAHQRSVLHRDLKPGNVLLDLAGQPHLTDFGLAKCLDNPEGLTLSGVALGSPNYMSPEQAAGQPERLTTAADIYSLGALMYEVLTGRPPFRADTPLETLRKVLEEPPVLPRLLYKFVDRDLETICLKCMEKEPGRRYGSAEALAEDLERWLRNEPILARPATTLERVTKWMRRNPRVAALVLLLHVVFVGALGVGIVMSHRIAAAKVEAEKANIRLAKELSNLQWQKVEELSSAGKLPDALAFLSRFLRQNPSDEVAAIRALSMLNLHNFVLPVAKPLVHKGPVNSATFSADGERVVSASTDGTAGLWDARNGELLARFTHPAPVRAAAFVGKSHRVLTLCDDGNARVWGVDGDSLFAMKVAHTEAETAKLSPDGKWFAACASTNVIRIFDTASGQPSGRPIPLRDARPQLLFSPDSRWLAVRTPPDQAELCRVPSGEPGSGPVRPGGDISVMAFSPDSRRLFIGRTGGHNALFDASTGALIKELPAHSYDVLTAEFSSDGERLVTIGFTEPIRVWNTRTWELSCPPFDAANMRVGCRFAPDGKGLVTFFQQGGARLRDTFTGQLLAEPFEQDGPMIDVSFSPDGGQLVTASQDGTAQLWTTRMRMPGQFVLNNPSFIWDAQLSPDGTLISVTVDNAAQLLDARTGRQVGKPMPHRGVVYAARFSPDGKRLATGSHDSTARVWSVPDGAPVTPELIHQQRVMLLTFSPDSQSLLTASDDRTAKLWNATTGKLIFSLPHDSELTEAQFSGDGDKLVTATSQGSVSVWAARTGQLIQGPLRHKGVAWMARFNHSGSRLLTASSDKSARLWDVSTGKLLQSFHHPQGVLGAVFSPDENSVLTASLDGMARLWDIASGEMLAEPMRHSGPVWFAFFSPDGRRVATTSEDSTSRLWDAATGYPLNEPLLHKGRLRRVQFSADGQRIFTASELGSLRIEDNPKPPPPAPAWFCDLIEALAGRRLDDRGNIEPVSHERLDTLRLKFSNSAETDFYSRWAHWFFVERSSDPAPAFKP